MPKNLENLHKNANISDGILHFRCNLFELPPVIECWLRIIRMHKKRHSHFCNLGNFDSNDNHASAVSL